MRDILRCCLVAVLIVSLAEAPVCASPSPVLGVILEAEHAQVGGDSAVGGATIFDGDTLTTLSAGALRVRLGSAQIYLPADSATALRQARGTVSATLRRGTVVFSSAAAGAIEVRASEARIRPRTSQVTLARITLVGPNEFLLTCQRGLVDVLVADEAHAVPEGTSYRVVIEPQESNPQGGPPHRAGRSHFLLILLIGIGVGTGIGVWRALVSPDKP